MSQRHVDRLRPIYEEWARGNFRAKPAEELFDRDIVFTTFAAEGDELTYHGRDTMVAWLRDFFFQWTNFRWEARQFVDCDDKVLVIGRQYGEGKESGVPVEMLAYGVWTFRDDRVVELHVTRDRATAFAVAGMSEQPSA